MNLLIEGSCSNFMQNTQWHRNAFTWTMCSERGSGRLSHATALSVIRLFSVTVISKRRSYVFLVKVGSVIKWCTCPCRSEGRGQKR